MIFGTDNRYSIEKAHRELGNVLTILSVLHKNLESPRGIALALLSGVAFLLAWSIRGIRWKLFLNPVGKVSRKLTPQISFDQIPDG